MKANKEDKLCFILHTISATLFMATGIIQLVINGFGAWIAISNIALGITFGSMAYMYYKKYKSAK